jgi:hypothetical protein
VRITYTGDNAAHFAQHLVRVACGGWKEVGGIDLIAALPLQFVHGELKAVLVNLEQPSDTQVIVTFKGMHHLGNVVPHAGFNLACPIAQGERQVRITGLFLPYVLVADQKRGSDNLIRLQFTDVG